MVITKQEFDLIKKIQPGHYIRLKVDFGLNSAKVLRRQSEAIINGSIYLDLSQKVKDQFCYLLDNQGLRKIAFFFESTNKFYKLLPTSDWPTFTIGSVPMHKLKSPKKDTQNKIAALRPYGRVLDTCMGLGYTAILAAKTSKRVLTFEKDQAVFKLAELNPLSSELFSSSNIEIHKEDVVLGVQRIKNEYFDSIIHDPPTFKLSGELYSGEFYLQLKRILKTGGKLFHYTPLYKIKQGFDFPASVEKRLKKLRFRTVSYSPIAGGFICKK